MSFHESASVWKVVRTPIVLAQVFVYHFGIDLFASDDFFAPHEPARPYELCLCLDVMALLVEHVTLFFLSTVIIATFSALSSIFRRASSCRDLCHSCVAIPRPFCACPLARLPPRLHVSPPTCYPPPRLALLVPPPPWLPLIIKSLRR